MRSTSSERAPLRSARSPVGQRTRTSSAHARARTSCKATALRVRSTSSSSRRMIGFISCLRRPGLPSETGHRHERLFQVGLHFAELRHAQPGATRAASSPASSSSLRAVRKRTTASAGDGADLRTGFQVLPHHIRDRVDLLGPRQQHFHRPRLAELPRDLVQRAEGPQPAARDDGDAVADPRQLRQDVAGDEQRLAAVGQVEQHLAHLDAGLRVEAVGRLVEDEHSRVVQQRAGDGDALLHAVAERLHVQVAEGAGAGQCRALRRSAAARSRRGMPKAAPKKSRYSPTRMLS